MNSNFAIHLEQKTVISINGSDVVPFLQSIISNDIQLVDEKTSIYSCLLTPQGKFLYDFIITKKSSDHYLLQCNKLIVDDLIAKLTVYKLRSQIQISKVDQEYVSLFFNMANEIIASKFNTIQGFTIQNQYGFFFNDPRLADLGVHGIILKDKFDDLVKELNVNLLPLDTYVKICHQAGLVDLVPESALSNYFSLELNLKELNGVSFKKGCFVGQENTARMNLKNKIRKRVFPIQIIQGSVEIGQSIKDKEKTIGKIISLDPACFGILDAEESKHLLDQTISLEQSSIKILKPYWLNLN